MNKFLIGIFDDLVKGDYKSILLFIVTQHIAISYVLPQLFISTASCDWLKERELIFILFSGLYLIFPLILYYVFSILEWKKSFDNQFYRKFHFGLLITIGSTIFCYLVILEWNENIASLSDSFDESELYNDYSKQQSELLNKLDSLDIELKKNENRLIVTSYSKREEKCKNTLCLNWDDVFRHDLPEERALLDSSKNKKFILGRNSIIDSLVANDCNTSPFNIAKKRLVLESLSYQLINRKNLLSSQLEKKFSKSLNSIRFTSLCIIAVLLGVFILLVLTKVINHKNDGLKSVHFTFFISYLVVFSQLNPAIDGEHFNFDKEGFEYGASSWYLPSFINVTNRTTTKTSQIKNTFNNQTDLSEIESTLEKILIQLEAFEPKDVIINGDTISSIIYADTTIIIQGLNKEDLLKEIVEAKSEMNDSIQVNVARLGTTIDSKADTIKVKKVIDSVAVNNKMIKENEERINRITSN